MKFKWSEISHALRSPAGRFQLLHDLYQDTWPLLSRATGIYRKTIIRNTKVVAVVGSFGKSTTVRAVITALGQEIKPWHLYNSRNFVTNAMLRTKPGARHKVVEVGINGPGQMRTHAKMVQPDITVVTSIGSEHNRSLTSLEMTRTEKADMVRILPASGLAVLNGDDPNVRWMASQTKAQILFFGLNETNDVYAEEITLDWPHGTRFRLHVKGETRQVRVRLLGKQMVYPVLAAVTVALSQGFSLQQILPALESLPPTRGRLEPVQLENGATVLCDYYKAPLETVKIALELLSDIPARQRIVLLGEVQEPPGSQHRIYKEIGERLGKMACRVVFIGSKKSFKALLVGAKKTGPENDLVHIKKNILDALKVLPPLDRQDVVLIKGRCSQRLERLFLALNGKQVRCNIGYCDIDLSCQQCPMLAGNNFVA